jgi:hypothetical protein
MASTGKKKTTMAKLQRESRLRERRHEKEARKRARKDAAAQLANQVDAPTTVDDEADDRAPDDEVRTATADIARPSLATSDGSPADSST